MEPCQGCPQGRVQTITPGAEGTVFSLIVVGFSAPHSVRAAMVLWFKTHYPKIPVVVLQFSSWEKFPEADVSTFSEDPTIWLTEVAASNSEGCHARRQLAGALQGRVI